MQATKQNNSVDFDDLIVLPVVLFEQHPQILEKYRNRWRYISVDEFQDTNAIQLRFLQLLSEKHGNICAIGDSDQSIYAFRGADISNILNFGKIFPNATIIKLEQNYRSTQNILDAADQVIANNTSRVPKKMWTDQGAGDLVEIIDCDNEREEAQVIAQTIFDLKKTESRKFDEFAVLVRMNSQTRSIEEAFMRNGIPYQIIGGLKFYARKEIKDILAYLRFLSNAKDGESLLRVINLPPRKIGATSILKLSQYASDRQMSLGEVIEHIEFADGVPAAAKKNIAAFAGKIQKLRDQMLQLTAAELIQKVIETFGLEKHYRDGSEEGESRFENILELISVARKFDSVNPAESTATFLEEVALIADTDNLESLDRVTLMTLHSSKGLEFPVVFLPGLEEAILPHSRSMFDPDQLEEERRLMYVGMTRAMKSLFILRAKSRMAFGNFQNNLQSRFLEEIPTKCVSRPNETHYETGTEDFAYTSIEEEISQLHGFESGDEVRHALFGQGTILDVKGDLATIRFNNGNVKKLALNIAPLEKVI